MIIAQFSIAPVGKGTSVHSYVQPVIDVLKKENIFFLKTNPMSTIIEVASLEQLFSVVTKAHNEVLNAGAQRVITELKIDDRQDKKVTMSSKINSLEL